MILVHYMPQNPILLILAPMYALIPDPFIGGIFLAAAMGTGRGSPFGG